ncbi:hypothetical protein BDY17DRAFT_252174 [Neohortaea acidophila]|uniref:Uncharacterized protein n=1 Tax=Neohortaea acidophila TaxID=245834 RepID=A0A6A6PSV3_9PEZI|nr:uncharacterized protein BDY17DRAFT_252174 [Neohortaea acidophila]KAF2482764.1 hypothetical protein BDY17DRAFT_252174 [Neohortaea acidophila]
MSSGPGSLRQLWFRWKALNLPWRRQFLVGFDLAGNTFWQFKDAINANRLRRIVKFSRKTHHADVKISPQWYQWLHHTREAAPTIQEQQYEVSRQHMMKQLAAEADERWKSKPSYLDPPSRQQPVPAVASPESASPPQPEQEVNAAVGKDKGKAPAGKPAGKEPGPWDRAQRGAPSEKWQPASWTPGIAQRR